MHLIERFSSHLRDVLARSIHLATELKSLAVEPSHLLFALANQKGSVAAEIISRFKISPAVIEQALLAIPSAPTVFTPPTTIGATAEAVLTPLSNASKQTLEKAMLLAHEHSHSHIGTEHLLAALVSQNDALIDDILKVSGVKISELLKQLNTVLGNSAQFPALDDAAAIAEHLQENLGEINAGGHRHQPKSAPTKKRARDSALEYFSLHLTDPEIQATIDPVIGRELEIERIVQILCRRTKNNPLLLGEPGVGKTAIVEGLAKRILAGAVPEPLLGKKIYGLDMGLLIAGTIYRGEFEGRLRQVVEEVESDPNIILFIDEVHNIVGAGSNGGTMDAANLLKPALARGAVRCIGSTTPAEFKKYIESDSALERRFQPVMVAEPSTEDAIAILGGLKKNYENYHHVRIEPAAIEAAVRLSERYITGKHLPDKAIDVLDETAAAKRLRVKPSSEIRALFKWQQKLNAITAAKERAAHEDRFSEAVELKKQEEGLRAEVKRATALNASRAARSAGTVTAEDVANQIAKIIGTKPSELILKNSAELQHLEQDLKQYVIGQAGAIKEVATLIAQAQLGLSRADRPLASFLFVGESGVGKTELAKTLARTLYHDKDALIKLDMSEFNESFSVSKLLGSPAGYVGYKESNQFTDKLKLHPYSVVLFDEIDKAHKDVARLLLQILENGEITDAAGKTISLRHAIIILTTSLGAADVKRGVMGFGGALVNNSETKTRLTEKLKEYFSPEIINRLDAICLFNTLTPAELVKIAELELQQLNLRLTPYHTALAASERTLRGLIEQLPQSQTGARDVRRTIRARVEQLMAEVVLGHAIKPQYQLALTGKKLTVK